MYKNKDKNTSLGCSDYPECKFTRSLT
ncbi:MAG: topoisomerase DNA-binding C4 zinc finger domain-containing protein [Candidatus Doudnabacteria bacterium]|nr:topoisomerase DNA-binding C4 zinc finger domain-containing protein [Candidatus Doudnabacteria bacterium]